MIRTSLLLRMSIALAAALIVGLGLASAPLRIDASAVPFDGDDEALIGLAWDDCLVITFGNGELGIALIPFDDDDLYQASALERVYAPAALTQSGLIEYVGRGVTFVQDCCDLRGLLQAYAKQLKDLGLEVTMDPARPRTLHASMGDLTYRIVFSYEDSSSVRVYIGS